MNITATASDEENVTWKWQKDGSDISGATGVGAKAVYNKNAAVVADAGSYTVIFSRVSDSSSVTSDPAEVTVNASKKPEFQWKQDLDDTEVSVNSGETVTLSVEAEVVMPAG